MMTQTKVNPAALDARTGLGKSKRRSLISEQTITKPLIVEEFAQTYVAQKYQVILPVARVIVALSGLGGRLS